MHHAYLSAWLIASFLLLFAFKGTAQCPNNVLPNPGFEQGLSNWTILGDAEAVADPVSGNFAAEIGGDGDRIFQTIPATPGNEYNCFLTWKKLGALGDATAGFKFLDAAYIPISFHLVNLLAQGEFETIAPITAIAPQGTAYVEVTAFTNAQSPAIRVDDFCLNINGGMNIQADLSVSNIQGVVDVDQGGDLLFTFDLVNQGLILVNQLSTVVAILSEDDNLGADDIKIGEVNIAEIPIGTLEDLDMLVSVPFNFPEGAHRLFLIADANDVIVESNEFNNTASTVFTVESSVINPPGCDLSLEIGQAGEFNCSDSGTPDDPSDDTWGLPFLASNSANPTGTGWRVTGGGQSFTGSWDEEKIITGFLIADGQLDLVVSDLDDPNCSIPLNNIPPPSSCSNGLYSGCSNNLLPNSGFENNLEAWTVVGMANITADAVEGTQGLSIAGDGNQIVQNIDAEAGDIFSLSAQARKLATNGSASIGIKFLSATFNPLTAITAAIQVSDNYEAVSTAILEAPAGTKFIEISAYTDPGSAAILVDDFCLRKNSNIQPLGEYDFSIENIDCAAEGEAGEKLDFSFQVRNDGDTDYPGEIYVAGYISTDGLFSSDDVRIGLQAVQNMPVGSTPVIYGEFDIPNSILEGEYHFILRADDGHVIVESQETNNWQARNIAIKNSLNLISVDCQATSPLPREEYLSAVKINDEEIKSGKQEYSDFRNVIFDIPMLEANKLSLTVSYENLNYPEFFRIFVDFNHDGWYEASEIYFEGILPVSFITLPTLTLESEPFVPHQTNFIIGKTNMRIVMSRDGYPLPCGEINNGDVEDYAVNIAEYKGGHPFSIRNDLEASELKTYPNPAEDYFNINLEDAFGSEGILYLTNAIGQIVWQTKLEDIGVNVYSIDTTPMGPGLYGIWLKAKDASPKFAKVMIKQ